MRQFQAKTWHRGPQNSGPVPRQGNDHKQELEEFSRENRAESWSLDEGSPLGTKRGRGSFLFSEIAREINSHYIKKMRTLKDWAMENGKIDALSELQTPQCLPCL